MSHFQASASAEEFMQQLPQYDQDWSKKRQEAEDSGEVSIPLNNYLLVMKIKKKSFSNSEGFGYEARTILLLNSTN